MGRFYWAGHGDIDDRGFDTAQNIAFLAGRFFHPGVVCAQPGGTCARINDALRILERDMEAEQRLMRENGYAGLAGHEREHAKLLRRLRRMRRNLVCGDYDNAVLHEFLTTWRRKHHRKFDKPFHNFLHGQANNSKNPF